MAFVFTGKTAAQRESRTRRLERSTRRYFADTPYPWVHFPATHYHQAVPVVVTELEGITAVPSGAASRVWRRLGREEYQPLSEALDSPGQFRRRR
ncbi:hypothetical protein ABZ366_04130 [Streptomyces sp. NPDC005904]|uniref:hypothetical protein n=1 Tax=Streptomyces sp. NPDC005904 TaxID=3154570 RepID=UPI00340A23C0